MRCHSTVVTTRTGTGMRVSQQSLPFPHRMCTRPLTSVSTRDAHSTWPCLDLLTGGREWKNWSHGSEMSRYMCMYVKY